MTTFGDGVRQRRLRVGLTQSELAARAGISVRGIRELESGRVGNPRPSTVRALGDALGVDPVDRDAFRTGRRPDPDRSGFRWPRPRQLPAENPRAVCRAADLAALDRALLGQLLAGPRVGVPIALVTGPFRAAGELALRWAHRSVAQFPHAHLVAGLREPDGRPRSAERVLRGFLRALGVPAAEIPAAPDEAAALYRSLLCDRPTLVLLSDVADADQLRPLLPGTPGAAVLATSRVPRPELVVELGAVTVPVTDRRVHRLPVAVA